MDCPAAGWWEIGLNLLGGFLVAHGTYLIRRARRDQRAITADRAQVSANLARAEQLLADLDRAPWAGMPSFDPDPPVQ